MRKLRFAFLISLIYSIAAAQPPGPGMGPGMGPGGEHGPMREKIREKIKTIKIWRLTEATGLTSEQSEKFFPIYNKYQDELEQIDNQERIQLETIDSLTNDDRSSDARIREAMDKLNGIHRVRLDIRNSFMKDISGVLTVRQQGKLLAFEDRFNRELQNLIWNIRRELRGGPRRDRR